MDRDEKQQTTGQAQRLATLEERVGELRAFVHKYVVRAGAGWLIALSGFLLYQYVGVTQQQGRSLAALSAEYGDLDKKVGDIQNQQRDFLNRLLDQLVHAGAAAKPSALRQRLRAARAVLEAAKGAGFVWDPRSLANLGRRLEDIGESDPGAAPAAWDALTSASNYRSFLNSALIHPPLSPNLREATCIKISPGSYVHVAVADSVLADCAQSLDGASWTNVVFKNVRIEYRGGPAELRNVRFENCTFEIAPEPPGKRLANALFASTAPTVSLP